MPELEPPLRQAMEVAFGGLAFLLPEPLPGGAPATGGHAAAVRFAGPRRGVLLVRVAPALLPVLAANMTGDDGAGALGPDALAEVANVICGAALPGLCADGEYRLAVAEAAAAVGGSVPDARVAAALDEGWAEVSLYLEDGG